MLFRQLFDRESSTYTYLLASRPGGEALLIDPVKGEEARYGQLLEELGVKLVYALDTHVHADHVTALGALRDVHGCTTVMGDHTRAECVSLKVKDGDTLGVDGAQLRVMYTPGHTDDSYSFLLDDRVFTGDTLLIRSTGRTDFQNGDARAQYDSLFNKLLRLPDDTLVYPAHDYKGWTVSTIGEERRHNPRLQVASVDDYVALMGSLNLPHPKMMDVAVPANLSCGVARRAPWAGHAASERGIDEVSVAWLRANLDNVRVLDVRELEERTSDLGSIDGSEHIPLGRVEADALGWDRARPVAVVCRSGGRSALATQKLLHMGFEHVANVAGGMLAWKQAGHPTTLPRGTCG